MMIKKKQISAPAVKVPVRIEDVDFQMEVDTGTVASIMSYTDYERYFKYLALRPVNKSFHAYFTQCKYVTPLHQHPSHSTHN